MKQNNVKRNIIFLILFVAMFIFSMFLLHTVDHTHGPGDFELETNVYYAILSNRNEV